MNRFIQLGARFLAWAFVLSVGSARAADPHPLVRAQRGEVPIILSAPHGGRLKVPGAEPRRGEGLERRPGGFVTARDGGTEELAIETAAAIRERLGGSPYFVIARSHRTYLDPNRDRPMAYESDATGRVYDAYHSALDAACREVQSRHHLGLLLDLHGQGTARDTVFRGTKNGQTVALLRDRFGESAQTGALSFFGQMKARGWRVHPDPGDGREQAGFTGGYIVQHYGGHQGYGIDAIQLEFGADFRQDTARPMVAKVLADVVADYASQFLGIKVMEPRMPRPAVEEPAPSAGR